MAGVGSTADIYGVGGGEGKCSLTGVFFVAKHDRLSSHIGFAGISYYGCLRVLTRLEGASPWPYRTYWPEYERRDAKPWKVSQLPILLFRT